MLSGRRRALWALVGCAALGCAGGTARDPCTPARVLAEGARERLAIEVARDADEGTWHAARRLRIALTGAEALEVVSDDERGVVAPIMERQYALEDGRFVVLGWSSTGGGMQTLHAWLIERRDGRLVVADRLEATTDRGSAGLLVAAAPSGLRIGIAEPGAQVHEPSEWALRLGERTLSLDAIRALPCSASEDPARWYRPPLHVADPRSPRVVLFAAAERFCAPGE